MLVNYSSDDLVLGSFFVGGFFVLRFFVKLCEFTDPNLDIIDTVKNLWGLC